MTDVSSDLIQAAVEASVKRSIRRAPIPAIRHGTIDDVDNPALGLHQVLIDGDTDTTPAHDISTGIPINIGDRVTVLFAPPHQALIIGAVNPKGPLAQQTLTSNGTTLSADAVTDMSVSAAVITGHIYQIHLHSTVEFAGVVDTARWNIYARVNGVSVSRLWDLNPGFVGVSHWTVDGWVEWTSTITGVVAIEIFADETVNGADLTFQASSVVPRVLTVYDTGILQNP